MYLAFITTLSVVQSTDLATASAKHCLGYQMMITLEEEATHLSYNTFHAQVQSQILDLLHSNMVQLDCNFNVYVYVGIKCNGMEQKIIRSNCVHSLPISIYLDSPSLCNDEIVAYNQLDQTSVLFPPTKI